MIFGIHIKVEVSKTKAKVILIVAIAIALLSVGIALASIKDTKHDLSAPGVLNEEMCVWCHTPPHAIVVRPIWNKAGPAAVYTLYGTTIAGPPTPGPIGRITKACLSCHDGVSAINSLVNPAGPGAVAGNVPFGTTPEGTAFAMPVGAGRIGTDLGNDHPVSIDYIVDRAGLKSTGTPLTGWHGAATIANLLRVGRVECSSCHDPHVSSPTLFLRASNTRSALCLGCHAM